MGILLFLRKTFLRLLALCLVLSSLVMTNGVNSVHAAAGIAELDGNLEGQPVNSLSFTFQNEVELLKDTDKIFVSFPEGMPIKDALENVSRPVSISWNDLTGYGSADASLITVKDKANGKQVVELANFTKNIPVGNIQINFSSRDFPILINPIAGIYSLEISTSKSSSVSTFSFTVHGQQIVIKQKGFLVPGNSTDFDIEMIDASLGTAAFSGNVSLEIKYTTRTSSTTPTYTTSTEQKEVSLTNGIGGLSINLPVGLDNIDISATKSGDPDKLGKFSYYLSDSNFFLKATDHTGSILDDTMIYFKNLSTGNVSGYGSKNGFFTYPMSDGSYEFVGTNNDRTASVMITVSNGVATVGGQPISSSNPIQYTQKKPNFIATFKNEDGSNFSGGKLYLQKPGGFLSDQKINSNGQIEIYLEAGTYTLNYIKDQYGRSVPNTEEFTITDSHTGEQPLELTIQLKTPNVISNKITVNGNPITSGTMTISGNNRTDYYRVSSQVLGDGSTGFTLHLEPGDYRIESIYDSVSKNYYYVHEPLTVSVDAMNNVLIKKTTNFNGVLYNSNGQPQDFGWMNITSSDGKEYEIDSGSDGNYYAYLPDGNYTIETINVDYKYYTLNKPFEIAGGQLVGPLEIRPNTNTETPNTGGDTGTVPSPVEAGTIVVDPALIEEQTESKDGIETINNIINENIIPQLTSFIELVVEADKKSENTHIALEVSAEILEALKLKNNEGYITFKTGDAEYSLPLNQINLEAIKQELGSSQEETTLKVEIYQTNDEKEVLKKNNFEALTPVYEFSVIASGNEKTISLNKFDDYVTRSIHTGEALDKNKVTALRINSDGSYTILPTLINGTEAIIKSKTNSPYVLVTNDIKFNDIDGLWNKNEVNLMASKLLIKGKTKGEFKPQDSISRVELAVLLTRALALNTSTTYDHRFSDVKGTEWFVNDFMAAVETGIVKGKTTTKFDPYSPVSRQEAAAMIKRAMDYAKYDMANLDKDLNLTSFADYKKTSFWAEGDLGIVVQSKILSGKPNNMLDPQASATRAEMVSILHRFMLFTELMN